MKERAEDCLDCIVSQMLDTNLISASASVIFAARFKDERNPKLLRQARDMYTLFHNSSAIISNFMNNGVACEKCEYMEMIKSLDEEGDDVPQKMVRTSRKRS